MKKEEIDCKIIRVDSQACMMEVYLTYSHKYGTSRGTKDGQPPGFMIDKRSEYMGFFYRIKIASAMVMIISMIFYCNDVYADEPVTKPFTLLDENEIKDINKYADNIKMSDNEHITDAVLQVFDVSENGDMMIGFSDGKINAYNQEGTFIFSLETIITSYYYIEFYGDDILLYSVRSRKIYEVTRAGEVCRVWNRADTESDRELISDLDRPSREINGYTYETHAYPSQFVRISPDGEKQIIYKATHMYPIGGLLYGFFFLVVGIHLICSIRRKFKA